MNGIATLLVLASLITMSIGTLELGDMHAQLLHRIDTVILVALAAEWFVRVLRREWGTWLVIDFLAWFPEALVMLTLGGAHPFLRMIRLLRLLRLVRAVHGMAEFGRAIWEAREQLLMIKMIALTLLFIAGTGFYIAEPEVGSIPEGVYLAIITASSVGYGDITPVTPHGQMIAAALAFLGIGIIALPSAIIASALSKQALEALPESGLFGDAHDLAITEPDSGDGISDVTAEPLTAEPVADHSLVR